MRVYRVYDREQKKFIKVGERTNDIYVSKNLLESSLKKYFKVENVSDRFKIYEYDLVLKKEGN